MRHRSIRSVALLLVCGALSSTPVSADPILVTGGQYTATTFGSTFTFTGDGLSLTAGGGFVGPLFNCTPCEADKPLSLGFSGQDIGDLRSGRPGEFDGVAYAQTFLSGTISFTGPAFSVALLSPSNLIFTAPFSMTATIHNYANSARLGSPLFTASLAGSGTATATFTAVANPQTGGYLFNARSVTYQFAADTPAPTPEPATLLLFGTGVAAIIRRSMRRV